MAGPQSPTQPATGSAKIASWTTRPAIISGAQRNRMSPIRSIRPPATSPTTIPIGIA